MFDTHQAKLTLASLAAKVAVQTTESLEVAGLPGAMPDSSVYRAPDRKISLPSQAGTIVCGRRRGLSRVRTFMKRPRTHRHDAATVQHKYTLRMARFAPQPRSPRHERHRPDHKEAQVQQLSLWHEAWTFLPCMTQMGAH